MKKNLLFMVLMTLMNYFLKGQNVFPDEGNAGIGTNEPVEALEIRGGNSKILFNSSNDNFFYEPGLLFQRFGGEYYKLICNTGFRFKAKSSYDEWELELLTLFNGSDNIRLNLGSYQRAAELTIVVPRRMATGRSGLNYASGITLLSFSPDNVSRTLSIGSYDEFFIGTSMNYSDDFFNLNDHEEQLRLTNHIKVHPFSNYYHLFDVLQNDELKFSVNKESAFFHVPVGIGTSTFPTNEKHKLYVKGGIRSEAIKLDLADVGAWGDHVFEEEHQLVSLEEVEEYIMEHKHLPQIPSAKELVSDGLDVSEMFRLQMIKIEEMTLYMIEQNKKMKELQEELTRANSRILELERTR